MSSTRPTNDTPQELASWAIVGIQEQIHMWIADDLEWFETEEAQSKSLSAQRFLKWWVNKELSDVED